MLSAFLLKEDDQKNTEIWGLTMARVARSKGKETLSREHYSKLLDSWAHADPDIPALLEAREFVNARE